MHGFSTSMAFTTRQMLKHSVVKFFRLRAKEVVDFDIIEKITREGYKLSKYSSSASEVLSETNTKYVLRKRSSDLLVFNQVILQRDYEPLLELIKARSNPEHIHWVLDAGANIGLTSLYLSKTLQNARFIAVEPSPDNFKMLTTNITVNSKVSIQAMQCALWFEHSRVKLSNTFRDRQEWSLQVLEDPSGQGDIEALTLHEMMTKGGTQAIDVLKIDIEGAEKYLLGDPTFISELKKTKFLAIELHEESVDKIQVIKQLLSLGFELTYKGETLFGVNLPAIETP